MTSLVVRPRPAIALQSSPQMPLPLQHRVLSLSDQKSHDVIVAALAQLLLQAAQPAPESEVVDDAS